MMTLIKRSSFWGQKLVLGDYGIVISAITLCSRRDLLQFTRELVWQAEVSSLVVAVLQPCH